MVIDVGLHYKYNKVQNWSINSIYGSLQISKVLHLSNGVSI